MNWMLEAYRLTRKDGAPGIDGVTAADYEVNLESNLMDLLERIKSGRYQAPPVRRTYIPKADGSQRMLGIPSFEDKVAQRAVTMVLEAIYEQDFLPCSYGFRPGRSPHQALKSLRHAIWSERLYWVIDLDIRKYFDSISHTHLRAFLDQRVTDGVVRRMIDKWLKAGAIEDGLLQRATEGTPQGGVVSPCLSNIFLHHVLDEWFEREAKPRLRGKAFEIRYADDAVICFQYREDAEKVLQVLPKRFARYGLTLHPEKTRLVEFGRAALARAIRAGTKPDTFDFLGMTHKCALSRRGKFVVHVKTMKKRLRRSLTAVAEWCRTHRHDDVDKQLAVLNAKLRGHYQYYGRPTNYRNLWKFYRAVRRTWKKWLERRTRGQPLSWERFGQILRRHPLLRPRIAHFWVRAVSQT